MNDLDMVLKSVIKTNADSLNQKLVPLKKVWFDPIPVIFMFSKPILTKAEIMHEQEERWQVFLEILKLDP